MSIINRFPRILRLILTGILLVFCLGGCAVFDWFSGEEEEDTPAQIMGEGIDHYNEGRFKAAADSFQKIKDRYPYSKFAAEAEWKMADSLYERELFDEAFDAYDEFERLHPKNKSIPYVIYKKGMCNFKQMTTIDREQTHTLLAKEQFERLIKKYYKSDYANKARWKLRECYIHLAEYELYVGHYYFKMKKYKAAMARYLYLIRQYPDFGQYHSAIEYLSKCKEKLAAQEAE